MNDAVFRLWNTRETLQGMREENWQGKISESRFNWKKQAMGAEHAMIPFIWNKKSDMSGYYLLMYVSA